MIAKYPSPLTIWKKLHFVINSSKPSQDFQANCEVLCIISRILANAPVGIFHGFFGVNISMEFC